MFCFAFFFKEKKKKERKKIPFGLKLQLIPSSLSFDFLRICRNRRSNHLRSEHLSPTVKVSRKVYYRFTNRWQPIWDSPAGSTFPRLSVCHCNFPRWKAERPCGSPHASFCRRFLRQSENHVRSPGCGVYFSVFPLHFLETTAVESGRRQSFEWGSLFHSFVQQSSHAADKTSRMWLLGLDRRDHIPDNLLRLVHNVLFPGSPWNCGNAQARGRVSL